MNRRTRQLGRTATRRREPDAPDPGRRHRTPGRGKGASARDFDASASSAALQLLNVSRYLGVGAAVALAALVVATWTATPLSLLHKLFATILVPALALLVALQWRNRHEIQRLSNAYHRAHLLAELNSSVIASFAMAIDAKDQHTHGHTQRVRDIAVMIAGQMGLSDDETEALETAAMLHDIGKLAVPDYILSKPDVLTEEEMKKVRTHTLVGAAMLESVQFPWPVVPIIRSHHEWYDGKGYPDGFAGDQIPLGARILAVADVYDALLSHRSFRPAKTVQEAVTEMRARSGSQFDPEILQICLDALASQETQARPGFIFDAGGTGLPYTGADAAGQRAIFMDIRQAHQELLALYEIVQTMGQSLNMQETADLIISKTKRIIDFTTCVLFLREPEDDHLMAVAASGPHSDAIHGRRVPLGSGVSGMVALTGAPSNLESPAVDDLVLLLGPKARNCSLTGVLAAPLTGETGTIGTITLYRTTDRPFTDDDARLVTTVARQAAIAVNNAREYERTKQSALTDQLTGLANARCFFMHLEQELSRAEAERTPVSLIAIDLNKLKQVNDNFGHQQGDRVLRILAEVFQRHVRESDTVVRYAGDEFFIILPNTGNKRALETSNRIKRAVRETTVELLPGRFVSLSASFGVATFPGDANDAQALIAAADRAMYADKRLHEQISILSGRTDQENGATPVKETSEV